MLGQVLASGVFLSLSIRLVSISFKSGNITLVLKSLPKVKFFGSTIFSNSHLFIKKITDLKLIM